MSDKVKIDSKIIEISSRLIEVSNDIEESKDPIDELKSLQAISKCWEITETTHIPDNNLLQSLSELTQTVLNNEDDIWPALLLNKSKVLLEIFKTWVGAGIINENLDYEIDDGSNSKFLLEKSEELRSNFYLFVQYFWNTIIMNDAIWNWHIKYLCDELQIIGDALIRGENAPHNLVINIPPATSKSTIVSVMFNAWLWANNPKLRVISSSHTAELSTRDSVLTRDIITSPKYRLLFPNIQLRQDSAAKAYYKNTEGGFRYTTSTSSTPTGQHADVRLIDDPLGKMQSRSEADRNAAKEHVKALATRVVSPEKFTPTIMVMQRLHPDDPTSWYLSLGLNTKHICLPAELSDLVSPKELSNYYIDGLLDPIRLSRDVLRARQKELGVDGYGGEYAQNPQAAAGLLYNDFSTYSIIPKDFFQKRYAVIDVAEGGGDDLCCIIADDRTIGVYVIDIYVSNDNTDITIPKIAEILTRYNVEIVFIEANNAGKQFSKSLKIYLSIFNNFTTKIKTFWSKINKDTRIFLNSVEVNNNTIFPDSWDISYPKFYDQVIKRQKIGSHSHDDCVDCLTSLHLYRPFKSKSIKEENDIKYKYGLL